MQCLDGNLTRFGKGNKEGGKGGGGTERGWMEVSMAVGGIGGWGAVRGQGEGGERCDRWEVLQEDAGTVVTGC